MTQEDTNGDTSQAMNPQTLNIIRFALLAGAVFFGVIAWFLTSSGQVAVSADEATADMFRYAFYGLAVIDLGAMLFMRQRAEKATSYAQRASFTLVGYALAEGLTLFGAVNLLLTGGYLLFLVGLLVFLLAFLMFPVASDAS